MENQNSILIKDEDKMFEEFDLIAKINQGDERQSLKVFKEEEEGYAETKL